MFLGEGLALSWERVSTLHEVGAMETESITKRGGVIDRAWIVPWFWLRQNLMCVFDCCWLPLGEGRSWESFAGSFI